MTGAQEALAIRYAARSDIGRCRETNQDSAYAGSRLLAVADGMGSGGRLASAAVIDALKPLETSLPAGDLLNALEQAVAQASATVGGLAEAGPGDGPAEPGEGSPAGARRRPRGYPLVVSWSRTGSEPRPAG